MKQYVHYLPGGGLGDVYREAVFHNAVGILRRWKIENPDTHLTVLLMSHNPSSPDLLKGLPWIDEVKALPFVLEESPDWEYCYRKYADEFAGKIELRFNIADRRSLYRAGFAHLRINHGAVEQVAAIGSAWAFPYTKDERDEIENYANRVVVHLSAGEEYRSVPSELAEQISEAVIPSSLFIGANYSRPNHPEEKGLTFAPRVLAGIIQRARGVIGTDSAPVYFASCLGVPRCMIYPPGIAFDKMTRGDMNWDWYFGLAHPNNLFVRTPVSEESAAAVMAWIKERLA